jgi:hypothetical protein
LAGAEDSTGAGAGSSRTYRVTTCPAAVEVGVTVTNRTLGPSEAVAAAGGAEGEAEADEALDVVVLLAGWRAALMAFASLWGQVGFFQARAVGFGAWAALPLPL